MIIWTIATNTLREQIRDKVLYNILLFALVMILSAIALGQLTLGHEDKVIVDLGLTCISVFGTLIAIFIGTSLVYKEIEKRTVYALLAKPVRRSDFILGKYLGLLSTLFLNVVIMTAGLIMTLMWQGGARFHQYSMLIPAVYTIFLALALTTALALLFSTFSTPALSAIFAFFLWVIGHFSADLLAFGALAKIRLVRWLCTFLYYILPNLSNFDALNGVGVIRNAAHYGSVDFAAMGWVTLYALIYSGILLALAMVIFCRREFK